MRALAVTLSLVAALVGGGAAAGQAAPGRLLVVAKEFEFRLSRASVPAGLVRIEVVDFGEDPHDLLLRRAGGPTIRLPVVKAGGRTVRTVRLVPGRYRLWCGVGDHRARGMWAWLRVTRR